MRWLTQRPWLLALIVVTVVAGLGAVGVTILLNRTSATVEENKSQSECLEDIVDVLVTRSKNVSSINREWTEKVNEILRVAILRNRGDQQYTEAQLQDLADSYLDVSKRLEEALRTNPIPPEQPALRC